MYTSVSRISQWVAALAIVLVGVDAAPHQPGVTPHSAVKPFKIDLSKQVPRMLDLVKRTKLPSHPVYPGVGSSAGIDLQVLKSLQNEWIHGFDWKAEQASLNK